MSDTKDPNSIVDTDDLWGQAMAEHHAASGDTVDEGADNPVFRPLDESEPAQTSSREMEMIRNIPVEMTVELGRTRMTINKLLELVQGSVIELDGLVGEPMAIKINGYLIGRGEVIEMDNKFGVRITNIVTPDERAERLAGIH